MKQGDLAKLNLFLSGLEGRMRDNRDFFTGLSLTFVSGGKTLHIPVQQQGGQYAFRYLGQAKKMDEKALTAFFAQQAKAYSSSALCYEERGRTWNITAGERGVQMKQTESAAPASQNSIHPLLGDRDYYIRVDQAGELLRAIGILSAEGKLKNDKIRKYNQIDHYVELVAPFFQQDDSREIFLLDCACGKSYLSFVLNYYITQVLHKRCRVLGVDISPGVIASSRAIADQLGYRNMDFQVADLREFTPPDPVTAVISLHACDIATDLALATAIAAKAKYIACVPCCHKELLEQYRLEPLEPLLRQGVFRARMNDLLTDSMRALKLEAAGYSVSAVEYISPIDTPKNLLIRAEWTGQENLQAEQEYQRIRTLLHTTSELDRRCDEMRYRDWITETPLE